MRGKLHKTQSGWTVTYMTRDKKTMLLDIGEVPLHPEDLDSVSATYVTDDHLVHHAFDGKNVEIKMQKVYEHGECDEHPVRYAKILRYL